MRKNDFNWFKRRYSIVVLFIAAVMVVIGCSSDDNGDGSGAIDEKDTPEKDDESKECSDCAAMEIEDLKLFLDGTVEITWQDSNDILGFLLKYSNEDGNFEEIIEESSVTLDGTPKNMKYTTLYMKEGDTLFSPEKGINTKGVLYEGFPEGFEESSDPKKGYDQMNVELVSGTWNMDHWLRGAAGAERRNGQYAARSYRSHGEDGTTDQPSILELLDNLPYGISGVEFEHGIVSSDDESSFIVEVTTDDGENWEAITDTIYNTERKLVKKVIEDLDFEMPSRVRFYYYSGDELGTDFEEREGRMNIDDIYIYAN